MKKILLITGGVFNIILTIFHIFLGYKISLFENIAPGYRELMIMLNVGGTLFILLFAIASLAYTKDMLTTRLGKLLIVFIILLYASRAVEEIIVSSHFSLLIFIVCVIIALDYLSILLIPERNGK